MSLLTLVPFWYRWAAIGLLVIGVWGYGYLKGREAGQEKVEEITQQIQLERDKQALQTAQKIVQQKEITENVTTDFEDNIRAIRAHYDQRLRDVKPATGVPAVPKTTPEPNESAADCRSSAEYIELEGRAAETTQQLIDLQGWVVREGRAN